MRIPYLNIGLYLAALIALLDQASKWFVTNTYFQTTSFVRVNDFLNLRLSWNKGVTFGLFNDFAPYMPYVLIATALLIVVLLGNWLARAENLYATLGLGCIIGGALGNVVDRLRFGAVLDFLDFHLMSYHWYTFNLADSAIVTGVGLLLLETFLVKRRK